MNAASRDAREALELAAQPSLGVNLHAQAAVIERAKLAAIGQRNLVEAERETRRRKQREVQALVAEKAAEIARLQVEIDSLLLLEQQQNETLARLANNESALL